ncbi:MAG: HD domain-containing protein [Clostridia bacterium]|nr:HD domain-containing protein [Clostridia bacterium]
MITLKDVKKDEEVKVLIKTSEKQIDALAYTEHSVRHASIVASWTGMILKEIGESAKLVRLGEIAGYLHDIGNSLARYDHSGSGAILAYNVLKRMGMNYADAAEIMMAIGNHDEKNGVPVSVLTSALIIADKSDVHKSRVRDKVLDKNTNIHDRVNLAVNRSFISVDKENLRIDTVIETDDTICSVADYFEIYHSRMLMCSKAAELLGYKYGLVINNMRML